MILNKNRGDFQNWNRKLLTKSKDNTILVISVVIQAVKYYLFYAIKFQIFVTVLDMSVYSDLSKSQQWTCSGKC